MNISPTRLAAAFVASFSFSLSAVPTTARPLSLEEALRLAQENSPLVRASQASVTAAEARVRQSGARLNPELDVELENAFGTGPYRGLGGAELTVALSQRFERGGKRDARQGLAVAELDLARATVLRSQADTSRNVRSSFADLDAAVELLRLAKEATGRAASLARTAKLMVDVGRDPPLRQLRAEAALAEAAAAEQRNLSEVQEATNALVAILDLPEGSIEPVSDIAPAPSISSEPLASIAVRIATAERLVAAARVAVEESQRTGDVTARAGVRGYAETDDIALVAGVTIPLMLRDRNRGGIEAARAEVIAAEARAAQAQLDAERDLRDARAQLSAAEGRLGALQGPGLEQAREAVRVAEVGYAAGKFSLLEVLDAHTGLNTLQNSIVEARRDRAKAIAALQRALGL